MRSEIELGGETYQLDDMSKHMLDNLMLEASLLENMDRRAIADLFEINHRTVDKALNRALAAAADAPIKGREAAVLRLKLLLQRLTRSNPTASDITAIVQIEKLISKLEGYDESSGEPLTVTLYRNPDEFETEADRARKDATAARTISGGGVALYLEPLDELPDA